MSELRRNLENIVRVGQSKIEKLESLAELDALKVELFGKKSELNEILKGLGALDSQERREVGALANSGRSGLERAFLQKSKELGALELQKKLNAESVDITLEGRGQIVGALHPITQTYRKIIEVLGRIGFDVTTGPEVETDYYCFEAVNIPKDHPARDMQDTFFVCPGVVLRTHTSPVQIRTMLARKWPLQILCPGAVYRRDDDATHSPMFHQIEGLWIDAGITMANLKGTLEYFAREIFGPETKIQLRPSYFPFVEPGAEVDVSCFRCRSSASASCRVCKGTGWLEILGAGMVHPHLFNEVGFRGPGLSGFAFGMGLERIAMLVHEIDDIRHFFSGDARFLSQFTK